MLCTIHIPPGIIKQLNRIIRQCFWRDNHETPKQSLAAWDMICKPRMKGGLGIIDFQKKNDALLLKFLHKFYNKRMDIPWVKLIWDSYYSLDVPHAAKLCGSYWWRDVAKLMYDFRAVAKPDVRSGETVLFWADEWDVGNSRIPLQQRFPRLFSFVKDAKISVRDMVLLLDRTEEFHLPLSSQAYDEFLILQGWMGEMDLLQEGSDEWKCAYGDYKPHKYYLSLFDHIQVQPQYLWIWKSRCTMKIKVFAWLLLSDRLNTKDMLQRRHWHVTDNYDCVLCSNGDREDRDHLFFNCNFSSRIWNYLQIKWGTGCSLVQSAEIARRSFRHVFFTEVAALACWHIWKSRNARVFDQVLPRFATWKSNFVHGISLLAHRFKPERKKKLLASLH